MERGGGMEPLEFPLEHLQRELKINDYPKWARDYLIEDSRKQLGRRDLRMLQEAELITKDEAVEYYRDLGYPQKESELQADIVEKAEEVREKRRRERQEQAARDRFVTAILTEYRLGINTRDSAVRLLTGQEWEEDAIEAALLSEDSARTRDLATKALSATKRALFDGSIELSDVESLLISAGFTGIRATEYRRSWEMEWDYRKRVVSASKIIDWVKRFLITPAEAIQRLTRMGWQHADILLMLQEAAQDVALAVAKAQKAAARDERERARADRQAARATKDLHDEAIAELMKHSSPARMKQWLLEGLIDRPEVIDRLRFMRWPDDDIGRYLAEVFDEPLGGDV
jgi:hypothetical protein